MGSYTVKNLRFSKELQVFKKKLSRKFPSGQQVQRIAQQAGPAYAQQVQQVQQQAQTQEAITNAQRKATSTTFNNRPIQPQPVPQPPPQPQLVSENRPRPRQQFYNPNNSPGFRPAASAPVPQPVPQRLTADSSDESAEEIDVRTSFIYSGFPSKRLAVYG